MLEIEIKAVLEGLSVDAIEREAERMGFIKGALLAETDIYFNGNDRNFLETDEALRLRGVRNFTAGTCENLITYKGPKLDGVSGSRLEYETAVGDLNTMRRLVEALGYREAFSVRKRRQEWKLYHDGQPPQKTGVASTGRAATPREITLCMDVVDGLGVYLELETLSESAGEQKDRLDVLFTLLDDLGVSRNRLTRKTYLELLYLKEQS